MSAPTIVLREAARYLFYTPFYVALRRDMFADEALDVRFIPAAGVAYTTAEPLEGATDVAWGGPSRLLAIHDREGRSDLVAFGEVVTRDPFFLMGRGPPPPGFGLRDLLNLRVGTVSEVPTPWLCLQEDLRREGIDPAGLRRAAGQTMLENMAALRRGELDLVQLFEPHVSALVDSGAGHVWRAGAARGPTSYTSLYSRRRVLAERRDALLGMVRAMQRALDVVHGSDAGAIVADVAPYFPDVPRPTLRSAIARMAAAGLWGRDLRLPRSGFDRLRESFLSGGYIATGLAFEEAVDNSLALEVMAGPRR